MGVPVAQAPAVQEPPRFQSSFTTGCFCNADPVPHCTGLQNLDIFAVFSPNTGALATVQNPVTSPDDVEPFEEAYTVSSECSHTLSMGLHICYPVPSLVILRTMSIMLFWQ